MDIQEEIWVDTLDLLSAVQKEIHRIEEYKQQDNIFGLQYPLQRLRIYFPALQHLELVLNGNALKEDLKRLINRLLETISQSERLSSARQIAAKAVVFDKEYVRSDQPGRPKISINSEEIIKMREMGINWTRIADRLNTSRSTLMRSKWMFDGQFSSMSDTELDTFIRKERAENPTCGVIYIRGSLLAKKYSVSRRSVRDRLRLIDPVGTVVKRKVKTSRREYISRGPNFLWHFDANEKLNMFGIHVHGCVDGFSRFILYLSCTPDKKASTVGKLFREAVGSFGCPAQVRCDKGGENVHVASFIMRRRGPSGCITGKSVHNTRIERLWREVNNITLPFKNIFFSYVARNILDMSSDIDVFCLHYIFLPRIQRALNNFLATSNAHRLRTENYRTPHELYSSYSKAPDVSETADDLSEADIDSDVDDTDCVYGTSIENEELRSVAQHYVPDPLDEFVCADDLYLSLKTSLLGHRQ